MVALYEEEIIDKDGRQTTTCESVSVRETKCARDEGSKEDDKFVVLHLTDNCLHQRPLCEYKTQSYVGR